MRRIPWLLCGLLISALLVAVLAWQNRGLRSELAILYQRVSEPYPGMWVPDVAARTLDGAPVALGAPSDAPQVLYFFSPTCPYCRQSVPMVKRLAQTLASDAPRARMYAVADAGARKTGVEAIAGHVRDQGFAFPAVALSDRRALGLFRANAVPLVVVIDPGGRVRHAHVGVLSDEGDLEDILNAVRLSQDVQAGAANQRRGR